MLILGNFGTANSGQIVSYQVLNQDKSVSIARTSTGVTELVSGSGLYGVTLADGDVIGKTVVMDIGGTKVSAETISAASSAPTVSDIDATLSAAHGSGLWEGGGSTGGGGSSLISWVWMGGVPLPQGVVQSGGSGGNIIIDISAGAAKTASAKLLEVSITQGDSPLLSFDLGADFTGWSARFGAKRHPSESLYVIGPKTGTWTDQATGKLTAKLAATDTMEAGRFLAEIEVKNGAEVFTAMRLTLVVIPQIIT